MEPLPFGLKCDPNQSFTTRMEVEVGWSQSKMGPCVAVEAFNDDGEQVSIVVDRNYPADCVPEPECWTAIGLCVIALVLFWRERKT